jgi:glycosyltransferase involved in cell wall biosynthesis
MNTILFSIIIPSFNRFIVLPKALDYIFAQQFSNYEIIIVDDGSTDNTEQLIFNYKDSRIRYIKKSNGGVCSARNIGIEHSKGEYIVFFDTDDAVSNTWLLNFYTAISKEGKVDVISGGMIIKSDEFPNGKLVKPTDNGKGAIQWAVVSAGTFAVKKSFLMLAGYYDENIKYGENTELFLRFKIHNPTVAYTNSFDFTYYPSDDGGSKNVRNRFTSNLYIFHKHASWIESEPKNKFVYLNILVVDGIMLKEYKKALGFLFKSMKMKPFYVKNYARLVQLFFNYMKTDLLTVATK